MQSTPINFDVIIERGRRSYGAYVPSLPGCVAVASTKKRVQKLIREAIALHVDDLTDRRKYATRTK
jgi:predicted RNase H-like HicB family nuclease